MQVSTQDLISGALSGCLVSFPTDTVPALATLPHKAKLIFAAKQRSQDKPLILMGAKAADLWQFVTGSVEELAIWQQVADTYWAGALTLVLPASERVPPQMNLADPTTIGLRVPNCAIAQQILAQTGPLATTSANISGEPPLQSSAEIESTFPDVLISHTELATESSIGIPSTVIKWTGNDWQTLRLGAVKLEF